MSVLIKGGRVLDPANGIDAIGDVLITGTRITKVGGNIDATGCYVIDAQGKWVTPGLIDMHVHLREPGFERKETIATGARSAAIGGFTTICAMPNTNPAIDSDKTINYIKDKAQKDAPVHVLCIGAITKGQEGLESTDIAQMAKAGICALSEDGKSVLNAGILKSAMAQGAQHKLPILSHCEDPSLTAGGQMHEGHIADSLGIKGISRDSEETIIARDILLAKSVGAQVHICHVSTAGGMQIIRMGKQAYHGISAEVCPHHFVLTDSAVAKHGTNAKMAPPLREQPDVDALIAGLKDGTVDVIATDHAPHQKEDKNGPFATAAFGIVGLETAFALGMTHLVGAGHLSPLAYIEKLTANPARILGIEKGTLSEGAAADIAIFDPDARYQVDVHGFKTKSKNSPFHGFNVQGKTAWLLVDGKIVVSDYKLREEYDDTSNG